MGRTSEPRGAWSWLGLVLGPAAALYVAFGIPSLRSIDTHHGRPEIAAAITVLMATWWLTEAVPIVWTACLPLLLFPVFGVFGQGPAGDVVRTVRPFGDAYVFLFFGGMTIGAAMEQWGLHRRIALHIMRRIGADTHRLLLGMLAATAFVSLWISNTATAVMMLPIAIALTRQLEAANGGRRLNDFGCALMLSVAYASNVGGIGTKIGTGTNSIFVGFLAQRSGYDLGFLRYSAVAFPFVVLFIPILWLALWRVARRDAISRGSGKDLLERELALLGPLGGGERKVAAVFLGAATLWMFSDLIRPEVAELVRANFSGAALQGKHYEAGVAMLAAFVLLISRTLSLASLRRLPYSTLLLLGGSFCMAAGIEHTGLSDFLGRKLSVIASLSLPERLLLASLGTVALSAVASNVASINVVLNVLPRETAVLFAAAIAASCDFMLPAGTPPNAIVFGSGYVRLSTMIRVGFVLDIAAGILIAAYMFFYGRFLLL